MLYVEEKEETFLDYFDEIADHGGASKTYSVQEILLIAICAMICGAKSWRDIVEFGIAI